ncbi:MAG TPA: enoyl-CoA hydratase [Candidatus Desulfobacillus sp.]|nr:enoyl-CoA hydratase [Candidatus Desulfobacillus sp.]
MSAIMQSADEPQLLRADEGGVATLTLNRPSQFNSLSEALIEELAAALDAIAEDRSVRVVVLAGAGKAFCAGHDLKEMRAHPDKAWQQAMFGKCGRMMLKLTQLPQPVIARVHGMAVAAGCQLVAMCDLAVAAEGVKFAVSGVNLGLFCSTPAVPLSRNLPRKQAFEMLVTGEFMDAQTALARGLVNRVVPAERLDEEVRQLADAILAKSPAAVAMGKQAFYRQIEMGLDGAYQMAAETMACNMMAEDAQAGIDAFIAKQPMPRWKGC